MSLIYIAAIAIRTNFKNIVLLLLLILLCHASTSAQTIKKIGVKLFEYQGQLYDFNDMDQVFNQYPESNEKYIKAKNKFKKAKILGYTSLSSLGLGTILIAAEGGCNILYGEDDCHVGIAGLLLGVTSVPLGISSLTLYAAGKRNKRKSLDLFNQAYSVNLPQENVVEVQFVLHHGLGLRLRF